MEDTASHHEFRSQPGGTWVREDPAATDPASPSRSCIREARLRPEFAEGYTGIESGVWLSAARLAEQLITRLLREGVPDEELPKRVLDPTHFEFRGGEAGRRGASTP